MFVAARRFLLAGTFALGTLAAGVLPGTVAQAGGTYVPCAPSVNTFVWDGGGDGVSWNDGPNWDVDCTPGPLNQAFDDVVSIGAGATVRIDAGESAYVLALDNQGTLVVDTGGVLRTIDDSSSATTLMRGLLFGTGRFSVTDTMTWESMPTGAATMSTRRCATIPGDPGDNCPGVSASPGITVVEVGAVMAISGRGVNLQDGRVIENHGVVELSGEGYVAADYGTAFRNLRLAGDPRPSFDIANDRGYYQGFVEVGYAPSEFTNTGRVIKKSGSGTSVVDATYARSAPQSPYAGTVFVRSGRLTVQSPSETFTNEAKVRQGSAFANGSPGSCAPGTPACEVIQVTPDDTQATSVDLTKVGGKFRKVSIKELAKGAAPGGFGKPMLIETPKAVATAARPIVMSVYLDAVTLGGATPSDVAMFAKVQRKGAGDATYRTLPDCALVGGPTNLQACVARSRSVNETASLSGDVVLVVKTLQNSRYRVGRIPSAT